MQVLVDLVTSAAVDMVDVVVDVCDPDQCLGLADVEADTFWNKTGIPLFNESKKTLYMCKKRTRYT